MLNNEIFRPEAPEKKIRTSDDFELCYLRHQYFRRVKYNPTAEEMAPYMGIVTNLTKNTFFTYHNLFKSVGMHHDDVLNIGRVHLVSFLGLYALDKMDQKKKDFEDRFLRYQYREAEQKDFDQKNKANFTLFFKQRMEDLVRVCRQKVRNIKGQSSEEFVVFSGLVPPPKYINKLLKNFEELGYKKIDFSVFKSIRKKADVSHDSTVFLFNGTWYVAISLEQKGLDQEDLSNSEYSPYDSEHHIQPDQRYMNLSISGGKWNPLMESLDPNVDKKYEMTKEEKESDHFRDMFENVSDYRKRVILQNFIAKNKGMVQYKEEIGTAKKLLRDLGGWIR